MASLEDVNEKKWAAYLNASPFHLWARMFFMAGWGLVSAALEGNGKGLN